MRSLLLLLIATALLSQSCQHADDDPWFTIYNRNQRVEGNWQLTSYLLEAANTHTTNTLYNSTACDTSNTGGTQIVKTTRNEDLSDTLLVSTLNFTQGSTGTAQTYDIGLNYRVQINSNGTYRCTGQFSYFNDAENAAVSGNFDSQTNNWFWEDSQASKIGITFVNFPTINTNTIAQTGNPIIIEPYATMYIAELRKDKMRWQLNDYSENNLEQVYEPYTILNGTDTLYNCTKTISSHNTISTDAEWTFDNLDED